MQEQVVGALPGDKGVVGESHALVVAMPMPTATHPTHPTHLTHQTYLT